MSSLTIKPKPKLESVHFIIEGKWFTQTIQDFIIQHKMSIAQQLMDDLKPLPTYEQRKNIVNGDAQFVGYTLCNDKKCGQCKPLRKKGKLRYIRKPDNIYKRKLQDHKAFLKKYYFEVDGDTTIQKSLVANLIVKRTILQKVKEIRYKQDDYERLENRTLSKQYLKALDDWEFALNSLYQEYGIIRKREYPVGTKEWKAKIEVESILDIIEAKAIYDEEIKELVREATNSGVISAMATEKMYAVTTRQMENKNTMENLAGQIKRKKPSKRTKETISIGGFNVPKHLIDDYKNSVNIANTTAMIYKAKYGKMDPDIEMKKLQGRIEIHKKIFEALKLPYHQEIDYKKEKLSKKEQQSIEFQDALQEYLDKNSN